jgi:hypothetical protein
MRKLFNKSVQMRQAVLPRSVARARMPGLQLPPQNAKSTHTSGALACRNGGI